MDNVFARSIASDQPAQSMHANLDRNFLRLANIFFFFFVNLFLTIALYELVHYCRTCIFMYPLLCHILLHKMHPGDAVTLYQTTKFLT